MLPPITKEIEVNCDIETAFRVFTDLSSWWPLEKRAISPKFGCEAQEITVQHYVGGEINELSKDGTKYLWGTIKEYSPFDRFSMFFHMGLEPCESVVDVTFVALGPQSTRVTLNHSNWEAYGDLADLSLIHI